MTAGCAASSRSKYGPARSSCSMPRPSSSPRAAAGGSFRSPPTARSRPATAWRWPIARARRSRTWSSFSTTRPGFPAPAFCSPRVAAARAVSRQQGRLSLPAGLRPRVRRAFTAQQGDGARPARPTEPGVLARTAEGPDDRDPLRRRRAPGPAPSRRSQDQRAPALGARSGDELHGRRSGARAGSGPARRTLHDGRHPHRHRRALLDRGPVRRGRVRLREHQRRQPPRLQLAHRTASCSASARGRTRPSS